MKAFAVHYLNVFCLGVVHFTEDRLDAYDRLGKHRVSLRLGGNGLVVDAGKENGASDAHDLSPIPKNCRVHKLHADGSVGLDELAESRREVSAAVARDGKILSIEAYKALGYEVDKEGNVTPPKVPTPEAPTLELPETPV